MERKPGKPRRAVGRAFLRREDGSAAPLLAFALVTLTAAAGLAFDGGRGYLMKAKLSQAVDAAALAGGRSVQTGGKSDHEAQIRKYFRANLGDGFLGAEVGDPDIRVSSDGELIEVSAVASLPTTLMSVLGVRDLQVSARSVVSRSVKGLEIVMVLDNSGSMKGGKLSDLKSATRTLLDSLYGGEDVVEDLHVSLVPFTARSNLSGQEAALLAEASGEADDDDDDDVAVASHLCFDLRAGQPKFDDTPPDEAPFVPYAGAFDPATDPVGYKDKICPQAALLPLAESKARVAATVESMEAKGCTRFDVGTAWGWRAISPLWRGTWRGVDSALPVDYRAPKIQKAVVIMTDGANTPEDCAKDADSKAASESAFAATCQAMKDQGVVIYTITFKLKDDKTNALFEGCASSPDRYFRSPDGEVLETAFATIAGDLTNLRLAE
ncbi:MAG: pilus assembly protein [Kiloniellales bacterium]|nr:pilus assembly protein [Kiloniellales bacterium]